MKSTAKSAQQSASTRFQIDQNTVVPSTQLGFYWSQERAKKRDHACVHCGLFSTMDSSVESSTLQLICLGQFHSKSTIVGVLTISAGA